MKISYTGMHTGDLLPKFQEKLDSKFSKLSKLLEQRGEKEAHVVVTEERHLHKAEITMHIFDHQLVGIGSDADLFTALSEAIERMEKQAVKLRTKWREKTRRAEPPNTNEGEPAATAPVVADGDQGPRIFRVNHHERRKPMTLEEAALQMEDGREYLVYRDSEKECVSVLVRRRDGHFDLIES
jgi:putative sigma-54 modulation protein